MQPDASSDRAVRLLRSVQRRRIRLDLASGLAAALIVFGLGSWIAHVALPSRTAFAAGITAAVVAAVMLWRRRTEWTAAAAARAIERVRPAIRNLVITAEELGRHPERASAWMTSLVAADASRAVADVRAAEVLPATRTLVTVSMASAFCAAALLAPRPAQIVRSASQLARATADVFQRNATRLAVTVRPPAYARQRETAVVDPDSIEVLEGSLITFALSGGDGVRLRFGTRALGALTPGGAPLQFAARDSGYFAADAADGSGPARLIALSVTADGVPAVRIERPARDLLLANAARSVPVTISASDDLGLASLDLRYTKVSGSGEQFAFQEGSIPLRLTKPSGREWTADAQMALAALTLAPGDSLVYRAVARDGRPGGGGIGSSDTFFIEIAGPGHVPFDAVEMPPNEERYALSQQMIVLKIERLKAREKTMARDAAREEAALLAAEQRSVRANFVFLLGGHVEDEEEEAEQASEIAEGRLENTARRDINAAIGQMTRAEQGLVASDTAAALPPARAAVEALQRAFGRSRYLLRTLSSRSRIDPSRRLTGDTVGAEAWRRNVTEASVRKGERARAILADVLDVHGALSVTAIDSRRFDALAERALAIDPESSRWQEVSRRILDARDRAARPADARSILDTVLQQVASEAAAGLVPRAGLPPVRSSLEKAWERSGSR